MKFSPEWARSHFPALDQPGVFLDGPAGSQVPRSVIDAIGSYYVKHNANHGGHFRTSRESDAVVDWARRSCADLFGVADSDCVVFGANMTTITFAVSRAISTEWQAGDEIIVTKLDHDGNVSPWLRAAKDRGVTVHHVAIRPEDCTLDLEDFRKHLSPRTKLVALGCVSNSVGTRNPVAEMTKLAHEVGALVYLDAVHHAPHLAMDVTTWDCDFVCCSAYKFFGPHVGVLYGKRHLLERLPAYKVRPSPETLPDRWMTGTQNFAAISGVGAAVEYLASIGRLTGAVSDRRTSLLAAFAVIEAYESQIGSFLIDGLKALKKLKVYGITDSHRSHERVPTISFTHATKTPAEVSEFLAERDIFVWSGNYYALSLTEALGLEPQGMVRVGLLHYNTKDDAEQLLEALSQLE